MSLPETLGWARTERKNLGMAKNEVLEKRQTERITNKSHWSC